MQYEDVCVSPMKGDRYRVNTDICYKDVTVPKGYMTNGADIPRVFWWLIPPNKSDCLPAVIVHDYLCDHGLHWKADWYFDEILRDLKVNRVCRFIMVTAVRTYHTHKYGKEMK